MVTIETRRAVRRMVEEVSRGFIDDAEVAFPDDEDLSALQREAREAAQRRRPGVRRPRPRRDAGVVGRDREAHSAG
jgi:hypothetical protein